jgi:hypothetical protein
MLYAVVLIAFRVFIDPYSSWRHFLFGVAMAVAFTLFWVLPVFLVKIGTWSLRFIAIGLFLGAALENRALAYYASHDLLRLKTGTALPKGWYPLTVPVHRVLMERGWASMTASFLFAHFVGMALSGILCGVLVFIVGASWRRLAGNKRTAPASGVTDGR